MRYLPRNAQSIQVSADVCGMRILTEVQSAVYADAPRFSPRYTRTRKVQSAVCGYCLRILAPHHSNVITYVVSLLLSLSSAVVRGWSIHIYTSFTLRPLHALCSLCVRCPPLPLCARCPPLRALPRTPPLWPFLIKNCVLIVCLTVRELFCSCNGQRLCNATYVRRKAKAILAYPTNAHQSTSE